MSLLEEENKLIDEVNIRSVLISNIKKIPPYDHFDSIKIINLPEVFDGTWILKRVLSGSKLKRNMRERSNIFICLISWGWSL
jgi:hypothetical protein